MIDRNVYEQGSQAASSRRQLLTALGAGAAALTLVSLPTPAEAKRLSRRDLDILNFALQLEYLEAEFYRFATGISGLPAELTSGVGDAGPTQGGAAVPFSDEDLQNTSRELAADETKHVVFLRAVLGRRAVAKPTINLAALGIGFANETEFLLVARAFEDTGVTAYGGAAGLIKNEKILLAAARILVAEAYHAGNIRFQVIQRGLNDSPLDGIDQPTDVPGPGDQNGVNFAPLDENGLSLTRTVAQVKAIVGPFFPDGLNGRL